MTIRTDSPGPNCSVRMSGVAMHALAAFRSPAGRGEASERRRGVRRSASHPCPERSAGRPGPPRVPSARTDGARHADGHGGGPEQPRAADAAGLWVARPPDEGAAGGLHGGGGWGGGASGRLPARRGGGGVEVAVAVRAAQPAALAGEALAGAAVGGAAVGGPAADRHKILPARRRRERVAADGRPEVAERAVDSVHRAVVRGGHGGVGVALRPCGAGAGRTPRASAAAPAGQQVATHRRGAGEEGLVGKKSPKRAACALLPGVESGVVPAEEGNWGVIPWKSERRRNEARPSDGCACDAAGGSRNQSADRPRGGRQPAAEQARQHRGEEWAVRVSARRTVGCRSCCATRRSRSAPARRRSSRCAPPRRASPPEWAAAGASGDSSRPHAM